MSEAKDLSVLISHESDNDFDRLTNVLKNSGNNITAKHIHSQEELEEELSEHSIDMVLAQQELTSLAPTDIVQSIQRLNRDIPVLIITKELSGVDAASGIRLGARDVITIDEDQHLIAVVNREADGREERSQHRDTLRRLYSAENRYQELLQHARLPMAIIHESVFLLANDAFIELFNLDKDEVDILSIIDILDKEAQSSYKTALKDFSKSPESFAGSELTTSCSDAEGQKVKIEIELTSAKYNNEDCLQLKIEPQHSLSKATDTDAQGPISSRNKLIQHIEHCISVAHSEKQDSSLLCIEIDGAEQLQDSLGISGADQLHAIFTDFLCSSFEENIVSIFDNNNIMVLLENVQGNDALELAQELCTRVEEKVFEFGNNSQQITTTVGISVISDLSTNADTVVKQGMRACQQLIATKEDHTGNGAHLYEPEKAGSDVDINYLLKQGFKHKHLQILFQPMMQFHGEAQKNYEVLLGIRPEHKDTYPKDFIALATRTNENDEIDRWVILEAMKTLLKKINCGGDEHLYIHISKQSLQNDKLASWIGAAIKKAKLSPSQFTFQLRESDASTSLKVAATFIKTLKDIGCSSVITHFGRSAQPMKILDQIPFDYAKIDGSFTLDAQEGKSEDMGKVLDQISEKGLKSIVPMVESATIMPVLWKSKVSYIQGYYVRSPGDKMDHKF